MLVTVLCLIAGACSSAGSETTTAPAAEQPEPTSAPTPTTQVEALPEDGPEPTAVPKPQQPEAAAPEPEPTALPTGPAPTPSPTPQLTATSTAIPVRQPECQLEPNAPGPASELDLQVEIVVEGLEVPWGMAVLPGGDLLLTERPGRVRIVQSGALVDEPVLQPQVEVPPPLFGIDRLGPEGGLLGLLLHPDFETTRQFYIFYNLRGDDDVDMGRVERYVLAEDGRSAASDRIILDGLPAGVHHQGGRMRLGPDGMLYVGVGAFEPFEAQDPNTLAGKLLRVDLDGAIPADNPDPSSYVFVSGIRNSQGFDWFDDDHLVMVDHGPSGLELDMPELRGFDEVNVARAGGNLGWPLVWGCDTVDGDDTVLPPVLTWNASVPPTGAVFYRDDAIPELTGKFLFTTVGRDFGQHIHSVEFAPGNPYSVVSHQVHLLREFGRLRTIVPDGQGGLYVMTSNCDGRGTCPSRGDVILRISAS